jgi:hypothetical protein
MRVHARARGFSGARCSMHVSSLRSYWHLLLHAQTVGSRSAHLESEPCLPPAAPVPLERAFNSLLATCTLLYRRCPLVCASPAWASPERSWRAS